MMGAVCLSALCPCENTAQRPSASQEGPSPKSEQAGSLNSGFPENKQNKFCCVNGPVRGVLFQQPEQTKTSGLFPRESRAQEW